MLSIKTMRGCGYRVADEQAEKRVKYDTYDDPRSYRQNRLVGYSA